MDYRGSRSSGTSAAISVMPPGYAPLAAPGLSKETAPRLPPCRPGGEDGAAAVLPQTRAVPRGGQAVRLWLLYRLVVDQLVHIVDGRHQVDPNEGAEETQGSRVGEQGRNRGAQCQIPQTTG